jgi:hypothetical protein
LVVASLKPVKKKNMARAMMAVVLVPPMDLLIPLCRHRHAGSFPVKLVELLLLPLVEFRSTEKPIHPVSWANLPGILIRVAAHGLDLVQGLVLSPIVQ